MKPKKSPPLPPFIFTPPPPPPAPPPPAPDNSAEIAAAALRERLARAGARGRLATILGGGTGEPTRKKTLLGG